MELMPAIGHGFGFRAAEDAPSSPGGKNHVELQQIKLKPGEATLLGCDLLPEPETMSPFDHR